MEGGTRNNWKNNWKKKGIHPESNRRPQASRLHKQFHNMSHKPLHYQWLTTVHKQVYNNAGRQGNKKGNCLVGQRRVGWVSGYCEIPDDECQWMISGELWVRSHELHTHSHCFFPSTHFPFTLNLHHFGWNTGTPTNSEDLLWDFRLLYRVVLANQQEQQCPPIACTLCSADTKLKVHSPFFVFRYLMWFPDHLTYLFVFVVYSLSEPTVDGTTEAVVWWRTPVRTKVCV